MAGGTSGQTQRIWLKKLNYSKYGNKRACSPGYCPQDKVYHNYGNIQGCYCGSDGKIQQFFIVLFLSKIHA